jgi:16S rRNA (guanine966-N2)-methyltransferase
MRVISGSAGGIHLRKNKRAGLRPTPTRVREALFSSLGTRVDGARVLDLFAGTGSFGMECLSRGCAHATFVEKDRRSVALLRNNLERTRLVDRSDAWCSDVRGSLEHLQRDGAAFDLIFADPPYQKGPESEAAAFSWTRFLLESPALQSILAGDGFFLLEHFKKDARLDSVLFRMTRQFTFGDTVVSLFQRL